MTRLLPELWSIIFLDAVVKRYEDMSPPSLPHGRFPPWRVQFAISAVCRTWREMCRGDSRIWKYATVYFGKDQAYAPDLGVHCSLTRGELDTLILIRPYDMAFEFDTIASFTDDIERIRTLKAVDFSFRGMDIDSPDLRHLAPFGALLRSPTTSQFQTLVIRHLNEQVSAFFRFTPQPSLRHLECHYTSLIIEPLMANIESLRLHGYRSVYTVVKGITSMAQTLRILELQLPPSVWKNRSGAGSPKLILPVLEVIRTPYRILVEILDDFFEAPNVHTHEILDVEPSNWRSPLVPSTSIRHSVQHLSLPDSEIIDVANVAVLLTGYPRLKTLVAHGSAVIPVLDVVILAFERSQPPPLEPLPAYAASLDTITLDTLHESNAYDKPIYSRKESTYSTLIFSLSKKMKRVAGASSPAILIGTDVTVFTADERKDLMS